MRLSDAFYKAIKSFLTALPVLVGVILLIGLMKAYVKTDMITRIFTGDVFRDTLTGSSIGSIMAGNPINSYVIAGELLKSGVSLFAVTSFLISWATVSIVQLPVEISFLGKRFALVRNILSFILSILIAVAIVLAMEVIS